MSNKLKGKRFYYLIDLQFLGFRYHGWQKQTNATKTVQEMLNRTIDFILSDTSPNFKTMACSRTDAMVSANSLMVELFIYQELKDLDSFKNAFNKNCPQDMKMTSLEQVDENFSIISSAKKKEYLYLFSFGEKNHPYCAPFMSNFLQNLDIELMKKASQLFIGTHNFRNFSYKPDDSKDYHRTILSAEIVPNTYITASFLQKKTYCFKVTGEGFLRNQIRMMVGALIRVGEGELTLKALEESLSGNNQSPVGFVASASGLHLNSVEFISS